jgi:hypothetical protein
LPKGNGKVLVSCVKLYGGEDERLKDIEGLVSSCVKVDGGGGKFRLRDTSWRVQFVSC